jgi:hypothetical protein
MQNNLEKFLSQQTKSKNTFSLRQLKKDFKPDSDQIKKLLFIGIIEPADLDYPDCVRAHYYEV